MANDFVQRSTSAYENQNGIFLLDMEFAQSFHLRVSSTSLDTNSRP
jgi:hypothetical protein